MANISVIGTGYVGLVSGICFAYLGHDVLGLDLDREKIEQLKNGSLPIFEPELDRIFSYAMDYKKISFTTDYSKAVEFADFIFIAVGTPPKADGSADLSFVASAYKEICRYIRDNDYKIIVNKSTVPVGTGRWARQFAVEILGKRGIKEPEERLDIVSNPEFLREGKAVYDFMNPDRVVIGSDNRDAAWRVASLYEKVNPTLLVADIATAEMIKYASNSFLAAKISFINEIANICERLGADVDVVSRGLGLDHRISPYFLKAGLGFGGSCFPKDVSALISIARQSGVEPKMLVSVMEVNALQRLRPVEALKERLGQLDGRSIVIWGLAFKPGTDDVRESPAISITKALLDEGAIVYAHDPVAKDNFKRSLKSVENLIFIDDKYDNLEHADALILVTEWQEYYDPDFSRFSGKVIFDGRNLWKKEVVLRYARDYIRIG